MTKRQWDALTKENWRRHETYGYPPHPQSQRSRAYKSETKRILIHARDPLAMRRPGTNVDRAIRITIFRVNRQDIRPHLRRLLGLE